MSEISYEEFKKVELRVGKVIEAKPVAGSEKLVQLLVSIGSEQRTIVAGIIKNYPPEALLDRQIIVVANLAPRSLMGIQSQGMVVAANGEDGPVLLTPDKEVRPGASIQ